VSLPSPETRELALLLVRKAEGDESILDFALDHQEVVVAAIVRIAAGV
jgi:hypothetical protein